MKIYKVKGCDKLNEWDFENLKNLPKADVFIYNYDNHGYEGSGFALWREGKKFGYTYISHCSCNGPLEDLNSILYTWPQIKKLAKKVNSKDFMESYEWKYPVPVVERMEQFLKANP
jgi:hypothetical protein